MSGAARRVGTRAVAAAAAAALACRATTQRPPFQPFPATQPIEVELEMAEATDTLARRLAADSIPVGRVVPADGYLETPWFDAASGTPTSRRPVGPEVVRVRGWVTPSKAYHSEVQVEAVYRPVADPSLDERELERVVSDSHPATLRVRRVLQGILRQFGDSAALAKLFPPEPGDTAKGAKAARPDSAATDSLRKPIEPLPGPPPIPPPPDTTRRPPADGLTSRRP